MLTDQEKKIPTKGRSTFQAATSDGRARRLFFVEKPTYPRMFDVMLIITICSVIQPNLCHIIALFAGTTVLVTTYLNNMVPILARRQ